MGGGGSALRVCAEHRGGINWLSLSPDGQRLLTGSEDGTARLWSTADGQCCALLRGSRAFRASCLSFPSPPRPQTSALPPTGPSPKPSPHPSRAQPGQLRTSGWTLGGLGARSGCSGVSGREAPFAGLSLVNPSVKYSLYSSQQRGMALTPSVSSAFSGLSLVRAPLAGHLPPPVGQPRGLRSALGSAHGAAALTGCCPHAEGKQARVKEWKTVEICCLAFSAIQFIRKLDEIAGTL